MQFSLVLPCLRGIHTMDVVPTFHAATLWGKQASVADWLQSAMHVCLLGCLISVLLTGGTVDLYIPIVCVIATTMPICVTFLCELPPAGLVERGVIILQTACLDMFSDREEEFLKPPSLFPRNP